MYRENLTQTGQQLIIRSKWNFTENENKVSENEYKIKIIEIELKKIRAWLDHEIWSRITRNPRRYLLRNIT